MRQDSVNLRAKECGLNANGFQAIRRGRPHRARLQRISRERGDAGEARGPTPREIGQSDSTDRYTILIDRNRCLSGESGRRSRGSLEGGLRNNRTGRQGK